MKFTLTFDGRLPPTANGTKATQKKWEIRRHFHPQLQELWSVHPSLKQVARTSEFPVAGGILMQPHHTYEGEMIARPMMLAKGIQHAGAGVGDKIDLCAPIERGGRRFRPLVRDSYSLICGLKILFLRREPAGRVYQGGDIDNRIKTLLDALAVPAHPENVVHDDIDEPIFCLLEDDRLVSGLSVQTERLLSAPNAPASEVRLVIEVDVRVSDPRIYNQAFLGD